MKTTKLLLPSSLLILSLSIGLMGCNQEEFFQKGKLPPEQPYLMVDREVDLKAAELPDQGLRLKRESLTEIFHQSAEATQKLDILWIIDDSRSMEPLQENLANNFDVFIRDFITKEVDFKMAITTTDKTKPKRGLMVPFSDELLNSKNARINADKVIQDFKKLAIVGTKGSGYEAGLEASKGFIERYANTFLRPEAYLVVIIISDEEDQSSSSVKHYTDRLKKIKRNPGLVKIFSIVDIHQQRPFEKGIEVGSKRYEEASARTAGTTGNVFGNFHSILSDMSENILVLLDSFSLAEVPVAGSLKVYVNGVASENYKYNGRSNSIKFLPTHLPPAEAEIKVIYDI